MVQPFEFEFDFSPAWLHVGQHMHWTPRLENLADQYVRKSLGVEDSSKTPLVRDVTRLLLFKMYIDIFQTSSGFLFIFVMAISPIGVAL